MENFLFVTRLFWENLKYTDIPIFVFITISIIFFNFCSDLILLTLQSNLN